MSDHVFDAGILHRLQEERIGDGEVILGVDYRVETNGLIDPDDACKVLVEDGAIVDIGKGAREFNAVDTGIFLATPALFEALEESVRGGDTTLSAAVRLLAVRGRARAFDIGSSFWIDVDDVAALRRAEEAMLASLAKPSDGAVARYLNRPVSARVTKLLLRTRATPNLISVLSFLLCVLGALCFTLGGYAALVLGAVLGQLSSIVDGCDGEVARLKHQASEFGGWFDSVLDRYADGFFLLGLTWYVSAGATSGLGLLVGFLALMGTFMNSYMADKYDGLMRRLLGAGGRYFRIGRDTRMLLILLGAVLNLPFFTLLVIAMLTNAENARRVWFVYRSGCR